MPPALPTKLKRQFALTGVIWLIVWLAVFSALRPVWLGSNRWLVLSGLVLGYNLLTLWRNLPLNRRPDEIHVLTTLGPGNALSLARGLGIGLIAGFLFGPWPPGATAWAIVLIYTAVDVADFLDGYAARRANHVTLLGSRLDIEYDGLGTLVVILLAVSFGRLPWWYLALGLARYFFLFGLRLRERLDLPVYDLTPSVHRRVFAGSQMGFLSVVLWPVLPQAMALVAGSIFAAATAAGFLRDWLIVSGGLDPQDQAYRRLRRFLFVLFVKRLPLLWRGLLLVAALSIARANDYRLEPAAWRGVLESWEVTGTPATAAGSALLGTIFVVGTIFVTLGVLGRLFSIALALPIGFDIAGRGPQVDNLAALVCIVLLMLLGTGPLSLLPLEERFVKRRAGSAR